MRINRYFMAAALCGALIAPVGFAARAVAQDPNYRQDDPNYRSQDPNYRQDRDRDDRQNPNYGQDRDHDRDRDNGQYGTGNASFSQMAHERGFQDGLKSGENDLRGHHSFRPTDSDDYKHGDAGYRSDFGDKRAYRDIYRQAYEEGYRQGFYGNSRHGDHDRDDHDRDDRDRDR